VELAAETDVLIYSLRTTGTNSHFRRFDGMHFPKLTPLQGRAAASICATALLVLIYFTFTPQFAYASLDVEAISGEDLKRQLLVDHNGEELVGYGGLRESLDEEDTPGYQADFFGTDRGIIGRAPAGDVQELGNNVPINFQMNQGQLNSFACRNATLFGDFANKTDGLPSALPADVRRRSSYDVEVDRSIQGRWVVLDDENEDGEGLRNQQVPEDWTEVDESASGHYDLRARQNQDTPSEDTNPKSKRVVYISLTTCMQPVAKSNKTTGYPPPLELYISESSKNKQPGPNSTNSLLPRMPYKADGGFAMYQYTASTGNDVNIGVYAPESKDYTGIYNYDIAISIDAPYHSYEASDPNLFLVDTDTNSALLITDNLTQADPDDPVYKAWANLSPPPFVLYAYNENNTWLQGVSKSICGLDTYINKVENVTSQVMRASNPSVNNGIAEVSMTTRGINNKPKEQFYITGLNGNTNYVGMVAMIGNSTASGSNVVGGGGKVWIPQDPFQTKNGRFP
jgi:calcium channel MID1